MGSADFRETVAIIGPGLIGGSIALSLRRSCPASQLRVATFSADELARARSLRLADVITGDLAEAVRGADLIVLCTPIDVIPEIARDIAPHASEHCVITDSGSVKRTLVASLTAVFGSRYVGAHPMAGSEHSGLAAAQPDLFDGAICFVVPGENAASHARVTSFWRAIGCVTTDIAADAHDEIVARVSHLPHLVAAALLATAARYRADAVEFAGPGFLDATRVASGPSALWRVILSRNRDAVRRALAEFRGELEHVEALLVPGRENDLRDFLESAAKLRASRRLDAGKTD